MPYPPHDGTPVGVLRYWAGRAEGDARQHYAAAGEAFRNGAGDIGQVYQRIAIAAIRRADSIRADIAAMNGTKGAL